MVCEARLSMPINVTKMHGARNDFVILDRRRAKVVDLANFARWACDRRAGIGADGVIVLESSAAADLRMRTINADGSEAEMCGNGIRCAARWFDEVQPRERITFETEAGIITTEIVARGEEYRVRVAMGTPVIDSLSLDGIGVAWFVDLGNPHVVIFVEDVDTVDLVALAERLQHDVRFPNGTNVHALALAGDNVLRVRHWERGVGLTMACGTGVVASAAVAMMRGLVRSPVEVFVPGGQLLVEWDGRGVAYLTGPAVRVFDTEIDDPSDVAP